uniref:Uncharacterized protein n=1 Tax=Oryza meridionalis TaxID=40149 RepID=A0A0E0CFV8_9ORYZ
MELYNIQSVSHQNQD